MWGNTNIPLSISLVRDEIGHPLHDTIYIPAFDTIYYLIDIDL